MKKVILILLLLAGWNAQTLGGESRPLEGVGFLVDIASCCIDFNSARVEKRKGDYGFFAREGLAFSRIFTSPLNVVCPIVGTPMRFREDAKDKVPWLWYSVAVPCQGVFGAVCGACSAAGEVAVGTFEMLTSLQVADVYYPWESYAVFSRDVPALTFAHAAHKW